MCSVSGWMKLGGVPLSVSREWGVDAKLATDDGGVGDVNTYADLDLSLGVLLLSWAWMKAWR
jgi:hypothetical protein